jgi:hypothetical protein
MVRWGVVTNVSPLEVRFAGDTIDTPALQNSDLTLGTSDKVVVAKVSSTGWVVLCVFDSP